MLGFAAFSNWLATRPYIIALVLTLLLFGWMWSGHAAQEEAKHPAKAEEAEVVLPKVRIARFVSQDVVKDLTLYGRSEPNRQAMLSAEVSGKVVEVFAKRGALVKQGEPIVRLEINDRKEQLARAKALLKQREIEYNGAKKLNVQGFQGKARLAEAEAALVDARVSVTSLTLQIEKTTIKAPFTGILNTRLVEVGDFLGIGDPIAEVSDIDPIIVVGDVTEKDISRIHLGQEAYSRLVNYDNVAGKISYISSVSNPATNTFRIEVAIDNPDLTYLAGLSAELSIPLEKASGIKVTPAVLALNDHGDLGVKTVVDEHVVFTPIKIIKAEPDGVWLSGFSGPVDVITVGQGFVNPGDKVIAVTAEAERG
ncbi:MULTISPECIES: efflux RND transporter periplasmic adaptor subunit [unclassified Motilimonas]|uniref:efflux RND transporter periplasmic adaptor subunit n=1 Tax=Motilimonas TaxID=1914248 RepID=UPI001E4CAB50|nr:MULTISPECIES: efflux RND transporter periplasmic adaptor subunit [unclassified Motilimonas]MCE0559280.1 efflux RND transporter periplasmic adaptor subunit [Motilimonas sp. E26]MDO6525731.1 efflux RND transporter periplasmic adaptor subunit [Motilimonas sp. 1_MG-2023]